MMFLQRSSKQTPSKTTKTRRSQNIQINMWNLFGFYYHLALDHFFTYSVRNSICSVMYELL
jgi:hypothetical protein